VVLATQNEILSNREIFIFIFIFSDLRST